MTKTYPAKQANIASRDYIEGPKDFAERQKTELVKRAGAPRGMTRTQHDAHFQQKSTSKLSTIKY